MARRSSAGLQDRADADAAKFVAEEKLTFPGAGGS
jgi:hypothetical protein